MHRQRFLMMCVGSILLSCAIVNSEQFGKVFAQSKKEAVSPPKPTKKVVAFEDKFERDDLGDTYEILYPDPNRLTLGNGKLLIVATEPRKNITLLRQTFSGDFMATVAVIMQVTKNNSVGLYYWVDEENFLAVGVGGRELNAYKDRLVIGDQNGRQPFFTKIVDRQPNSIMPAWTQLGNRELAHFSPTPETWYLQLQREGSKYTGRISVDGVKWMELGTHVIIPKDGRLGLSTRAGNDGIENPAEFDNFVVQR